MIIFRQLRLPDGVGGGGSAEGAVEPGQVAYLRRSEVKEHAGDAALRYIAESRGGEVCGVGEARERCPHWGAAMWGGERVQ